MTDRVRLALAGDTMLGRGVGEAISRHGPDSLFSRELTDIVAGADLFVLNLECCISARGERWPDPNKPFFFRAPLAAIDVLDNLGVDCVTLANNHALDFGPVALEDTLDLLTEAGIAHVGAGRTLEEARRPAILDHGDFRLEVVGLTDHPAEYAATGSSPGVAFADLRSAVPDWVRGSLRASDADVVLVTPHWGPNMTTRPPRHLQRAAAGLVEQGAGLVAGHSAHVFHGIAGRVAFDLGDFIDDYAVDPRLRNDLGILLLVDLAASGPLRYEVVPLELAYCHTRIAGGAEADWVRDRFVSACAAFDTEVAIEDGRLVIDNPL